MQEVGTVTFFLYFGDGNHAAQARAALAAHGLEPHDVDPPEAGDEDWSVLAECELHGGEVEAQVERVRTIAAAHGGHLDGIATPWPDHPAHWPPKRP